MRFRHALILFPAVVLLRGTAYDLGFHPRADLEVAKKLEVKGELRPEKLEIQVNTEFQPSEELQPTRFDLLVGATDKYVETKDGRPAELLRTFDRIQLSIEDDGKTEDVPEFDALESKTVRFAWNADSETYEKSFHETKGEEKLLETLAEDMDLRVLLPAKRVSEGDVWEVAGDRLQALFLPGGLPGDLSGGEDDEGKSTAFEELRLALVPFQENLKVQCKYKGTREEGDVQVGEVEIQFAHSGKADVSRLVQSVAEATDDEAAVEADANADIDLSGSGVLLWHLADGRIHSFTMQCEAGVDVDIRSKLEIEGESIEIAVQARLAAKSEWKLTTSKP